LSFCGVLARFVQALTLPGQGKNLVVPPKGFLFLLYSDPKKEKEKIFNAVSSSASAPPLHRKSEDKAGNDSAERQVAPNPLARTTVLERR